MLNPICLEAHNPGPMTGSGNHTFLFVDDDGFATLVDAGVGDPKHLDAIAESLDRHHATLRRVLVTHAHSDHASGASALAQAHPAARFFKHLWPEEDSRYAVRWNPIQDGDRFDVGGDSLVALHTPGHSPDHITFWHQAGRVALSGDLVILDGSVTIQPSRGGDLRQYVASLDRLLRLAPSRLLPAHGREILDPERVLRGYIAHRQMREQQVVEALAAGHDDVPSIAESIYDGLAPALLPVARETVRAHLEKLRHERRAVESNGRWRLQESSPT